METDGNNPDAPETEGDAPSDGVEATDYPEEEGAPDPSDQSEPATAEKSGPPLTRWREIWPLPLLGLGAGLFAAGVFMALSTTPDPVFTPVFEDADRLIQAGAYEEAITELNARAYPYVGRPEMNPAAEAQCRILLARALYGGQNDLEFPQPLNDENIVDQYLRAENILGTLGQSDAERLARTYIAQGEMERARERAQRINDPEVTPDLYQEIIGAGLGLRRPDYARLLVMTDEYLAIPGISDADRVWGLARRAELQIELGYTDRAVNGLLREMPLLVGSGIDGVGELFMLLGRGYLEQGAFREAIQELRRADNDAVLPESDPARSLARLYLAKAVMNTAQDETDLRRARDIYEAVSQGVNPPEVFLTALLGLAEAEAALDDDEAALEAYDTLISAMKDPLAPPRPTAERVSESLEQIARRHESSWGSGGAPVSVALMLRYAEQAAQLFDLEGTPPAVLGLLSRAHEANARVALGFGPETAGQRFSLEELKAFDPATLREAKRHLIQSAAFARLYADRFIIDDYAAYADALWRSALLSDSAGDRQQAIASLVTFAESVEGDARQPEARYRLGQMFQARGEYINAAGYYEGLIEDTQNGVSGSGPWADLSYVPLAQCYIADVDDSNDEDAVRLLRRAIDGTRGGPERPEFLQAVIELGNLAMRQGRNADAVERFKEALERGEDGDSMPAVRFKLADGMRLLAGEINARLAEPLSDRERGILSRERAAHLRSAIESFTAVRDEFERRDPRTLSELETTYLRNSYFYVGDCAFDLGQYEDAIEFYNMARARYPRDPSVLVALIQVVNAYLELGDKASARTANERAKAYYQTLPEDVWDDPNLPLSRKEWERWLDANTKLYEGFAQGQ